MPAKKKAKADPIAEHVRLRDAAVKAVGDAADAIKKAHDAYGEAVQYARANALPKPETIDTIGARAQHSPKVSSADLRAGADPRDAFRRFAAVKNARL